MSSNLRGRLSRLESSIKQAVPSVDWRETDAYRSLSDADKETLSIYTDRFNAGGLEPFTDEELNDFELILMVLDKQAG